MDLSLSGTSIALPQASPYKGATTTYCTMLYGAIKTLGSLPGVALSALMAIVAYFIMLLS